MYSKFIFFYIVFFTNFYSFNKFLIRTKIS